MKTQSSDMDTRSHSVDRSPITASTERAHGGQGQHTPAPWRVGIKHPCRLIAGDGNAAQLVGATAAFADEGTENERERANAARIVACVNACEGMDDPAAEVARLKAEDYPGPHEKELALATLRASLADSRRVADELAGALTFLADAESLHWTDAGGAHADNCPGCFARAALARLERP